MNNTVGQTADGEAGATEPDFSSADVAHFCGISDASVRRAKRRGDLPFYKVGKLVRYRREDVDLFRNRLQVNRTHVCSDGDDLPPEVVAEIRRAVDTWPPLTQRQREAIAALFSPPASSS